LFRKESGKIIVALIFGLAAVLHAEPAIMTSCDYYDIEGQTADELRQQMNLYGVAWSNGNIYDAYTGWNVKWHYQYRPGNEGCSIGSVETTLYVEFRLPRWKNYSDGSPGLKLKWDAYMRSLRRHEDGHKKIGLAAAAEIERALAGMKPAVTCDEMAEAANKLGRRILAEYAEKEKDYDARTNFGEAQGAVFP
jgi:predicted secreted Zn-dependent protease